MSKKDLFKAAHDEYRKLLDAGEGELQRYIQQGRRATIASRAGGSTFGTQHQRRRAPAPQNIDEAAPGVDGAILVDADAAAAWQVVAAELSRIEVGDIFGQHREGFAARTDDYKVGASEAAGAIGGLARAAMGQPCGSCFRAFGSSVLDEQGWGIP